MKKTVDWGFCLEKDPEVKEQNKLEKSGKQQETWREQKVRQKSKAKVRCEKFSRSSNLFHLTQQCAQSSVFKYNNLFPLFIYWFRFCFMWFMNTFEFCQSETFSFLVASFTFFFFSFLYCFIRKLKSFPAVFLSYLLCKLNVLVKNNCKLISPSAWRTWSLSFFPFKTNFLRQTSRENWKCSEWNCFWFRVKVKLFLFSFWIKTLNLV